jgi:hypothetical protein
MAYTILKTRRFKKKKGTDEKAVSPCVKVNCLEAFCAISFVAPRQKTLTADTIFRYNEIVQLFLV